MSFTKKRALVSRLLCVASVTFVTGSVFAQAQSSPFSAKGKITHVEPGQIAIQVAGGKQLNIKVLKEGEEAVQITEKGQRLSLMGISLDLSITAHYTSAYLAKGMFLQFVTHLDDKGFAKGEVKHVTRLDPSQGGKLGVYEDADSNSPEGTTAYLVKGKVTTVSGGRRGKKLKVTVAVPKGDASRKGKISIILADDAEVTVYSEKLQHALRGDDIEVEGLKFTSEIVGTKVVITRYAPGAKRNPTGVAQGDKKPAADQGPNKGPDKSADQDDDGSDKTADREQGGGEKDDREKGDGDKGDGDKGETPGRVVIIN